VALWTPDRGKGYKSDPADVKARRKPFRAFRVLRLGAMLAALPGLPLATRNRFKVPVADGGPGILMQGQTGSCVGHATAEAITLYFALIGKPIPLVSPICIYTLGRDILRGDPLGPLPPLTDDGTEPTAAVQGVETYGCCSAKTWGNYPADPATINDEPTPEQLKAAADFVLQGAYFLPEPNVNLAGAILGLIESLAAGYPTTTAIPASGTAFNDYATGVLTPADLPGDVDHDTLFVDYEWTGSQADWDTFVSQLRSGTVNTTLVLQLKLFIQNSWSENWGWSDVPGIRGGFCQVRGDAVSLFSDLGVFDVTSTGTEA
jgi:hypothetical protein